MEPSLRILEILITGTPVALNSVLLKAKPPLNGVKSPNLRCSQVIIFEIRLFYVIKFKL